MIAGKRILVTGGTGSIGSALVKALYLKNEIAVCARDEHKITEMQRQFRYCAYFLADVRDRDAMIQMVQDQDVVIHCAALKHVTACENNPLEAVKTNILGTHNVFQAAAEAGVEACLLMSTDKASDPVSVMGMTKYLAEKHVRSLVPLFPKTRFLIMRNVNVLGSRGSVLEIWDEQLRQQKPITLTEGDMTRFVVSTDDVVGMTMFLLADGESGQTFVPRTARSVRMWTLLRAFLEVRQAQRNLVDQIGARPGEAWDETLFSPAEARNIIVVPYKPYLILSDRKGDFTGSPPKSDQEDVLMGSEETADLLRKIL